MSNRLTGDEPPDEILDATSDFIKRVGDSIEDTFRGQVGNHPLKGLTCRHGGHTYLVMASNSWEWIQIRYPLNVDHLYAVRRLDLGEPGDEFEITQAQIQQARNEFDNRLDDIPENNRREFRINLIQMLSREGVTVNLDTTTPLNIHGVNVDKRSYIFESDYSLSDFAEDLQTVINLGWVAKEFVTENYGFRPQADNHNVFGPDE